MVARVNVEGDDMSEDEVPDAEAGGLKGEGQ